MAGEVAAGDQLAGQALAGGDASWEVRNPSMSGGPATEGVGSLPLSRTRLCHCTPSGMSAEADLQRDDALVCGRVATNAIDPPQKGPVVESCGARKGRCVRTRRQWNVTPPDLDVVVPNQRIENMRGNGRRLEYFCKKVHLEEQSVRDRLAG